MGVPAKPSLHAVSAHGPVPRDDVLDHALQNVPVVGAAGCERGTVVERVFGLRRTHLDRGGEGVDPIPEGKDPGVDRAQIDGWVDPDEGRSGMAVGHGSSRSHAPGRGGPAVPPGLPAEPAALPRASTLSFSDFGGAPSRSTPGRSGNLLAARG